MRESQVRLTTCMQFFGYMEEKKEVVEVMTRTHFWNGVHGHEILTLFDWKHILGTYANRADSVQMQ